MEATEVQRGRDSLRRSPLDLIMSQIRRKRSAADRKPLGRLLSWSSERGVLEDGDPERREDRTDSSGAAEASDSSMGWGRVCVFLQRLGKKAQSDSLNLTHCDLTATDLLELATLLQFLPELQEVDVSWNELIGGSLRALTCHLQQVGGVRALRLSSCRLQEDDAAALGEALGGLALVQVLDLSWNRGLGGCLGRVLSSVQPPLRELHLVACRLTAADAAALAGTLPALHRLCVLDVSCNPLLSQEADGGGFRDLASALPHASSLTTLRLQGCGLTAASLHLLGGSLRGLPSLTHLDLSCNKHLSGGLSSLHLAELTHLESLDLHLSRLSQPDLHALIQVLPSLTALTELDVSSNQEAGGVVSELVSALSLTQMRRLPLNSCSLSPESCSALALAVPYLHSVDVSWSKAVGGRLSLLLDALQPSVLLELRLSSCELTAGDLRDLASVSSRGVLSSLRVLDLSYNDSSLVAAADGCSALLSAGRLEALEELDLSLRPGGCAPPAPWLPALLSALPRLPGLARLAVQRWTLGDKEKRQLKTCLKQRNVLLDWNQPDPELQPET